MSFSMRSVIVTGASSGIGRATAEAFAKAGARLVLTGRDVTALTEARQAVTDAGGEGIECAVDVTSSDGPERIVSAAVDAYGGVDVLVNAAGVIATGTLETTTDQLWDSMMAVNVRAPFRLMRQAAPHLAVRKGSVVNVSSVNGLRAFAGVLAYNVSKAAVDHLTRCAALEMAPMGVRVNAVNPGVTVTNLHRRSGMGDEQYGAFLERSRSTHPLGRPGEAGEIASLILYLASEQAAWMTGETIPIDGGRHLTCLR
jgi:NAD(P)-dependent dehydrogenase (short-subunit alcohol dehydrogenase family)